MNRIYQGRISKVLIRHGNIKTDEWQEEKNWEPLLRMHHDVFQDAVNYYLLALGALANRDSSDGNRLVRDLHGRLSESWNKFPRDNTHGAKSLKDSITPWLNLSESSTLDEAFCKILEFENPSERDKKIQERALLSLLFDLEGESKIQQGGRSYLPYFCISKSDRGFNFPREQASLKKKNSKDVVAQLLWSITEVSETTFADLGTKLEFDYFAKPSKVEYLNSDESKKILHDAVLHLSNEKIINEEKKLLWIKNIELLSDIQIKSYQGGSINKAALKNRFYAWLVFTYLETSEYTFNLLKSFFPQPKDKKLNATQLNIKMQKEEFEEKLLEFGDDPIKLARKERGYVFRAFTALPVWNPASPGEPVWREFDIAAFKEALKALNQFGQKTEDREIEKQELQNKISWMTVNDSAIKLPNKEEEESDEKKIPAKLAGDLRYALAKELENELSYTVLSDQHKFNITRGSLRCFNDLKVLWNKFYKDNKDKKDNQEIENELEKIVKNFQSTGKNKYNIGSVPLFLALCQKKYWSLWIEPDDKTLEEWKSTNRSTSILYSVSELHEMEFDLKRKEQAVKLTPAESIFSPRFFCFSDVLNDGKKKDTLPKMESGFYDTKLVCYEKLLNAYTVKEARLQFTAPRLHRDKIIGCNNSPHWLQPMMKALQLPSDALQATYDKISVSLMPSSYDNRTHSAPSLKYLLNFSVTVNPDKIKKHFGIEKRWKGNINGTNDKGIHLHWPGTITNTNTNVVPWWENKEIIDRGFTVLSNDLGQRSAGAWSLIKVSTSNSDKNCHYIGSAGNHKWYAQVIKTGLYRLPGDNEYKNSYDKSKSYPTKKGRSSSSEEHTKAKDLALKFGISSEEVTDWLGSSHTDLSFPEQNDKLIKIANQSLSRLLTYHRWTCLKFETIEDEAKKEKSIKNLISELDVYSGFNELSESLRNRDFKGFFDKTSDLFIENRRKIEPLLIELANRVVPLRDRSWGWVPRGNGVPYGDLIDIGPAPAVRPKIIGQRGLSLNRIEQLENLRKLFLRYNRSLERKPGESAKFGFDDKDRMSGEPCEILLDKINNIKDERINLTAHLIIAEALGVRLKQVKSPSNSYDKLRTDLHGEYETISGRTPVDFIVLEDLSSYKTSHEKGPGENKRLMAWAHRSVLLKVKELSEAFGMQILEVPAAFSSRFDSRNGVAGFRAFEVSSIDDSRLYALKKSLNNVKDKSSSSGSNINKLIEQIDHVSKINSSRKEAGKPLYTLLVPVRGGPLFIPATSGSPSQADINASINLGLRAIAAPDIFSIHNRIRAYSDKSGKNARRYLVRGTNKREQAVFKHKPEVEFLSDRSEILSSTLSLFFDPNHIGKFDRAKVSMDNESSIDVCSSKALWKFVKDNELLRCIELNGRRMEKWNPFTKLRREDIRTDSIPY
jgi:hypothetical protein